jgi:hypothetical protein
LVRRHCRHHRSPTSALQPAGQDPEALRARSDHSTALFAGECQSFLDNVIADLKHIGSRNDPPLGRALDYFGGDRNSLVCGRFVSGCQAARFLTRLLSRIAGGIVRCMPLSRPQLVPDLFSAAGDHEARRRAAELTSVQPADKSSPRYVLPSNLSNALEQLDDTELDRLVAAASHELQRRGRPMTSAPETRPATDVSPGEGASKPSITNDQPSERQQLRQSNGTLTQGQRNAVLASFKAGIAPSRIARQFGLSQSDVRKVLALEPQKAGKGR